MMRAPSTAQALQGATAWEAVVPWLAPSHYDAAIDAEHLTRNVGGFGRCEECHSSGNFLWRSGPAEWDLTVNRFLNLIG